VRTLVLATTNKDKIREIRPILQGAPVQLATLDDYPGIAAPEETGRTFAENAQLKALYYAELTGELVVAEDSGIEIDALDGAPGVLSSRYGGEETTYPEKFRLIYDALRDRGASTSSARFVCSIALAEPGRLVFEARGTVEGRIAPAPKGEGGFGYDPIFYYPPFGTTLADAADRKSQVSHRGQAFRALRAYFEEHPSRT
jgi:XTP/dITP diphosphohydrolase